MVAGLRSLFRKGQVDRELDEELRYMEMAVDGKMKQGMMRKEAARTVRLERGSLEVTKEVVRAAGWEFFVERATALEADVDKFNVETTRASLYQS
jgi:uncharacterized phage protein gp47/JayE